jgi:hypothetical protein
VFAPSHILVAPGADLKVCDLRDEDFSFQALFAVSVVTGT